MWTTIRVVRRKLLLSLGVVVAVAASACGSSQANSLQAMAPGSILSQSLRSAVRFGGVHYVLQTTSTGQKQTVTGDAGTNAGAQSIVIGSDQTVVEMIGTTAFLLGNVGGLENIFGFSPAQATKYAGSWISFQRSDSLYPTVVQGVTLGSLLSQLRPVPPLVESSPATVAGQQVVGVRGDLRNSPSEGEATFWVATAAPNVPVGIDAQATGKDNKTVTQVGVFSKWGERLRVRTPPGPVPFSSLASK